MRRVRTHLRAFMDRLNGFNGRNAEGINEGLSLNSEDENKEFLYYKNH